ncbi:MAG: S1 family peptidase [Polyangiaceae bacterium]
MALRSLVSASSIVTASLFGLGLASVGCSGSPLDPPVGTAEGAVIGGAADTTHEAVVAIISQRGNEAGACSGTIVKKEGRVAWVLTAAHCVDIPPTIVFMGPNYDSPDAKRFEVLDYTAHPSYNGQTGNPADVAVVRVLGANDRTPVIPITDSPDGLAVGNRLTSVGYGRTTPSGASGGDNTTRKFIQMSVTELSTTHVGYRYTNGNICQGDSGGPALRGTGSAERVVAVHSYVVGDCRFEAYSARLTNASNYQYVQRELAKAVPADTCDICTRAENSGDNTCAAKQSACFADKDCAALAECRNKCGTTTCTSACDDKYPRGLSKLNAAIYCSCSESTCGALCTGECRLAPKCGISLGAEACAKCTTGSCCDAVSACAADTDCFVCLRAGANADASCATNKLRKAVADCAATKCKAECASDPIGQGGEPEPTPQGPGAPGAGSTVTTTTTGCSTSSAPGGGAGVLGLVFGAAVLGLASRRRRRVG